MNEPAGIVALVAKEGRENDLLELLRSMAVVAAGDNGTEIYAIHQNRQDARQVFLYERYRDKEAFKLHIGNEKLRALGAGLGELTDAIEIKVGNIVGGHYS